MSNSICEESNNICRNPQGIEGIDNHDGPGVHKDLRDSLELSLSLKAK